MHNSILPAKWAHSFSSSAAGPSGRMPYGSLLVSPPPPPPPSSTSTRGIQEAAEAEAEAVSAASGGAAADKACKRSSARTVVTAELRNVPFMHTPQEERQKN